MELVLFTFAGILICVNPTDAPSPNLPKTSPAPVEVPEALRNESPFDVPRQLTIPDGFGIEVYARVPNARFVLVLPTGDALVSQPRLGKVTLLRSPTNESEGARTSDFITGLSKPHDMVLARVGNTDYIYISELAVIARYLYHPHSRRAGLRQIIVRGLPDEKGLRHPLKNIAINNATLYVSIGSATNDDPNDLKRDPKCGAIYGYPLSGGSSRLISEGVRNAEGLAFAPDTGDLWVVVNQRDNIKYPYHDKEDRFGQVIPEYVDDNPPEEFTKIEEGRNYGWPYCNPVGSDTMNDLTYVPDAEFNPDNSVIECSQFMTVIKGLEPHSAPLGLTFWTGDKAPPSFRNGALVGMHGSWNRQTFSGHKVAFFPWENGRPGNHYDLVTGWVTDPVKKERWGRPVDTGVLPDGSLLITDDSSGTVYRLYKKNL